MPRFPFSSYLFRRRRRRRLTGRYSRYSLGAERSAKSIDPLADFLEDHPRRKRSLLPSALALSPDGDDALYAPVADPQPAARRYVETSFHISVFRGSPFFVPFLSFVRGLVSLEVQTKLSFSASFSYLATRRKLYGATMEGAVMRTWVASMDRFDVLVDAGNSPLLPSAATRYRSQRTSVSSRSGPPSRRNKLDLSFLDRQPRFFLLRLLPLALLSFSSLTARFFFFLLFLDLPFRGPPFLLVALRRT